MSSKWSQITMASLVLGLLSYATAPTQAQSTPRRTLLALSKKAHTLSIVDPVTLKVLAQLPVGPDPHEVIATADGKRAYVSNMGMGEMGMGESYHEVDVLDLVSQKSLPNIDIAPLSAPHGLDFQDGKVWLTVQGSKAIARIDPATAKVDWIMGTGQDWTHMIYVTPDAQHIYASNAHSGTISLFEKALSKQFFFKGKGPGGPGPHGPFSNGPNPNDHQGPPQPQKQWEQTLVKVSPGSEGFDVSPDGRQLWTASGMNGNVAIIDLASKKVVATLKGKVDGANRVKFTPDGHWVFVSSLSTGDLVVFDAVARKEIKRISLGHGAAGIQMDGPDNRVFIGCSMDDYVAVVDLTSLELIGKVDVGGMPDGLAIAVRP